MQYNYVRVAAAVAAFIGAANAQTQCLTTAAQIPACALGFIVSAATSAAGCGAFDFPCQCSNSGKIEGPVAGALPSGCNAGSVLNAVSSVCNCATSQYSGSITLTGAMSSCEPDLYSIPACGLGYIAVGAFSVANCALDDFACQCSNSAAVLSSVSGDISSACGASYSDVLSGAAELCSCVTGGSGGGSGSSPSASATGSGSPSATASGSASASGSMSAAPTATGTGGMSMQSSSMSHLPTFTNAAVTAGPIGGVMALVAGLVAFL